ncbi:unnamed protein product [[Candida] boidinii]|nr:unnamed protein product [[Candida] boidinii]
MGHFPLTVEYCPPSTDGTIPSDNTLEKFSTLEIHIIGEKLFGHSVVHQVLNESVKTLIITGLFRIRYSGIKFHSTNIHIVHNTKTNWRSFNSNEFGPTLKIRSTS